MTHDGAVLALRARLRVADADDAFGARLERALLDLAARRRATDVERTHRELRARLADRLAGDDADRLADVDACSRARGRGRSTCAHTPRRVWHVSTERMTTSSMPASSICDDELPRRARCCAPNEHFAGERVDDVFERHAAEDAVAERLDDFAGVLELVTRMPSSVPQSNSVTTASCATSTRRRVR